MLQLKKNALVNDGDIKMMTNNFSMKILRARQSQFDQVFVCQVPVHCIDKQHNILMSASHANRVSHF